MNTFTFFIVSLLTKASDEEKSSADLCALDTIQRRKRSGLNAKSPSDFIKSLSKPLGKKTATREVKQALDDLKLEIDDRRPYSMRRLRGKLEANLSGLLGPSFARELIDGYLPYSAVSKHSSSDLNVLNTGSSLTVAICLVWQQILTTFGDITDKFYLISLSAYVH